MLRKIFLINLLFALAIIFNPTKGFSQKGRGHYSGGRGSSHKGGSYRNPSTGNHYRSKR